MPSRALRVGAAFLLVAGCNSGRDKLLADLQDKRADVRALAVKSLGEKFNNDDVPLFTQAARDPVVMVRAEAMAALAKSQDPRVVDLLAEALGDPDEKVQESAALALASIRSDKARSYLALQYGRRGRNTRIAIVQALKSSNLPGAMASVVAAEASSTWDRDLKALQSGALPERVGAAEELGRSGRPEAVDRLAPLLKDPQVPLAAAAARGLGLAGDPRAVPALTALLQENFPELREAACEALAELKNPASLAPLREVALEHSVTSSLAVTAVIALPRSPESDRALCEIALSGPSVEATNAGLEMRRRGGCAMDLIVEKLKNPSNAPAVLGAVVALGPVLKDLSPKLLPFLSSSDVTTRRLAADALVEFGDPAVGPAIAKAFDAELKTLEPVRGDWVPGALPLRYGVGFDPDAPSTTADPVLIEKEKQDRLLRRASALAEEKARAAGKVLIEPVPPRELFEDATDVQLQALASLIRALGRLKVEGAAAKVGPFVQDQKVLRAAAYDALASLGDVDAAKPGLFEPVREVQASTARALVAQGEAGQRVVLEAVGALPGDRTHLLDAFREVPLAKAAAPTLIKLLQEGGGEAGVAALLLADGQVTDAVEPLAKLLDEPTTVARRDIVEALGRLKDPRGVKAVARELFSDVIDVRASAAHALEAMNAKDQVEPLDALKGDYALLVRHAAAGALAALAPEGKR